MHHNSIMPLPVDQSLFNNFRWRPGLDAQSIPVLVLGCVYVLELEGGWLYVGYTQNIHTRLSTHFQGAGSRLTKRYRPVRCLQILWPARKEDETRCVEQLCRTHGAGRVRGGPWCREEERPPFP